MVADAGVLGKGGMGVGGQARFLSRLLDLLLHQRVWLARSPKRAGAAFLCGLRAAAAPVPQGALVAAAPQEPGAAEGQRPGSVGPSVGHRIADGWP